MSSPETDNEQEPYLTEEAARQLEELRDETNTFLLQRFIMWAVRWTIGFLIIWYVVSRWPELSWLWWVGGLAAALSLVLLVVGQWWVGRKFAQTVDRIEAAKADLEEDDGDTRGR